MKYQDRVRWPVALAIIMVASGTIMAAENADITGVWSHEGRFGRTEWTFAPDGTCQRLTVRDEKQARHLGR